MMSLASCTVAKSGHSCSYLLTFMNRFQVYVFVHGTFRIRCSIVGGARRCVRVVGGALLDYVTTPHRACDE